MPYSPQPRAPRPHFCAGHRLVPLTLFTWVSQNVALESDVALAVLLASGVGTTEAAAQVNVNRRTVQRKMLEPEFRRLMADVRSELLTRALGLLTENMSKAAAALATLIDDPDASTRLKAARTLLYLGVRVHDAVDVADRLRDVEDELARKRGAES